MGRILRQILLGALYVAFGIVPVSQPASLGLLLLISGIVRVFLSFSHWERTTCCGSGSASPRRTA
jgi:uncharacterized membrane protein HdeD (DUF308 family)